MPFYFKLSEVGKDPILVVYGKAECGHNGALSLGTWPSNSQTKPDDWFSALMNPDLSCVVLKATAFPYAPYTTLENDVYGGFEVRNIIYRKTNLRQSDNMSLENKY